MKCTFRQAILALVIISQSQDCFGQDTLSLLGDNWIKLKTQLQKRTDIVNHLVVVLSKSSKVDKEQLNNSKTLSVDLFKCIDTLTVGDSSTISLAFAKNIKLTQALARTLVTLENDKKFRNKTEVWGLLTHLEAIENDIMLAKLEYNQLCKQYQRDDLLFGPDRTEKASEVKF